MPTCAVCGQGAICVRSNPKVPGSGRYECEACGHPADETGQPLDRATGQPLKPEVAQAMVDDDQDIILGPPAKGTYDPEQPRPRRRRPPAGAVPGSCPHGVTRPSDCGICVNGDQSEIVKKAVELDQLENARAAETARQAAELAAAPPGETGGVVMAASSMPADLQAAADAEAARLADAAANAADDTFDVAEPARLTEAALDAAKAATTAKTGGRRGR